MHRRPRESGCGLRDSNGFLKELDALGLRFPSVVYGNLAVASSLWPMVCGLRSVASSLWPTVCGLRSVAYGLWQLERGS